MSAVADDRPTAVPLVEQLRSVPADAKLRIDTQNALGCMDTCSIPVGRLCHEAAAAIGVPPPRIYALLVLLRDCVEYLQCDPATVGGRPEAQRLVARLNAELAHGARETTS